jgi:catechol 2,3-dioxygenase-like lactoylglutathione lyase family enzyme
MEDVSQKHSPDTVRYVPLFDGKGIDHVGIRYQDLKKALGWFRDTLGLPVDHETLTRAFVRVGSDGSHLALFQAQADEPLRQPHHVALRVPDTDAAERALRTAGIPLSRFGPNWGFQDPEGNVFHFVPSR